MTVLFISYRRSDSEPAAHQIYTRLQAEFGPEAVFMDRSIIPGNEFPVVLKEALHECRILLAVIGPGWATAVEANGVRRLHNPRDFVRLEIETALQRKIPVVPILVGGVKAADLYERTWKLPLSLVPLRDRHVAMLADESFDHDLSVLVERLQNLLAQTPSELGPTTSEETAADQAATTEFDQEFGNIMAEAATGSRLIVLTGPAGIGKSTMANAVARAEPIERHRHIVQIDAWREFTELSLVDQVGRTYPEELYRDHQGVPFTSLPFRTQRHLAIDLLAKNHATVILDGPGEASYPRDAVAEVELAVRIAQELSSRTIRVIVATRFEAFWTAQVPIRLKGLAIDDARKVLQREFRRLGQSDTVEDMAKRLGGESILQDLLSRGRPGELLAAAQRACAAVSPAVEAPPTRLDRAAAWVRGIAERFLGDPVLPHPKPPQAKSSGAVLFTGACVLMLMISTGSLIISYRVGGPMWERMFFELATDENSLPALGTSATRGGVGPGWMVEFARGAILILGLLLVVIGWFFGKEAAALVPHAPWVYEGPRQLGLRSLFRIMWLVMSLAFLQVTYYHHVSTAPRILWMSNGNPYIQKLCEGSDPVRLKEYQELPDGHRNKMNGEPPKEGEPRYDEYWTQCIYPYRLYFPYSFVMFVLTGSTVLTVGCYAVFFSLLEHLRHQPKRISELPDDTHPFAVDNWVRYYKETYTDDVDRYLIFLLVMLGAWAYHQWFDRANMTGTAVEYTTVMILLAMSVWAGLFSALVFTYHTLIREAAKRIPEGRMMEDFYYRHGFVKFFRRTVFQSVYFWLSVVAGAILVSSYFRSMIAG